MPISCLSWFARCTSLRNRQCLPAWFEMIQTNKLFDAPQTPTLCALLHTMVIVKLYFGTTGLCRFNAAFTSQTQCQGLRPLLGGGRRLGERVVTQECAVLSLGLRGTESRVTYASHTLLSLSSWKADTPPNHPAQLASQPGC